MWVRSEDNGQVKTPPDDDDDERTRFYNPSELKVPVHTAPVGAKVGSVKPLVRGWVKVLGALGVLFLAILGIIGPRKSMQDTQPAAAAAPAPEATVRWVAESCVEMAENFGGSRLTDLQKNVGSHEH